MSQNTRQGGPEQNSLFAVGSANGPSAAQRERARWLAAELERHNFLYHTKDAPEISDDQFDALFRELADLEDRWPELRTAHSPTLRVGGKLLDGLDKKAHSRRMGECLAEARGWQLNDVRCSARDGIIGARPKEQIGIQAIRGGDVVGVHTVYFMLKFESIRSLMFSIKLLSMMRIPCIEVALTMLYDDFPT